MNELKAFLLQIEKEVEAELNRLLPAEEGLEKRLYSAMRYSCLAGGKRLRPALFAATLAAFGQERRDWMPFAAGLEMMTCAGGGPAATGPMTRLRLFWLGMPCSPMPLL